MKLLNRSLPNTGTVEGMLPDNIIKDIWTLIEEAKEKPIDMRKDLAGNIKSSIQLNLKSPITNNFTKEVLIKFIEKHIDSYGTPYRLQMEKGQGFNMNSMWVNFQRQTEFNPMHDHGGIFSFVIWLKIPTSFEEQKKLPIAVESNSNMSISNFQLIYTDVLGTIRTFAYNMEKEAEGYMVLFPAGLNHQVYPFYDNDEERISISGNVVIQ
tara:strand:- start:1398 stop:2027 length:630 start_codon:yes stop_codon:yes gene_type:complete